jgi:hypothetical protein
MATITDRMIRAARLDVGLYEEVEHDREATGHAMAVVVISSVASGVGSIGTLGTGGLLLTTLGALAGWYVWAFLTFIIGTRLLPEPQTKADVGELLRTTGFSAAPGVIRVLGIIPGLGALTMMVGSIWMLVAMVIAVRQALDYSGTGRALAVCIVGWLVQLLILLVVVSLFGGVAGSTGSFTSPR